MMSTGVFLSKEHLDQLSPRAREEVMRLVFGGREDPEHDDSILGRMLGKGRPADLTREQLEAVLAGLSRQSLKFLLVFVDKEGGVATTQDLLEGVRYDDYRKLTGITSGLTKRVRAVLKDDKEELVSRSWDTAIPQSARTPENARHRISASVLAHLNAILQESGAHKAAIRIMDERGHTAMFRDGDTATHYWEEPLLAALEGRGGMQSRPSPRSDEGERDA